MWECMGGREPPTSDPKKQTNKQTKKQTQELWMWTDETWMQQGHGDALLYVDAPGPGRSLLEQGARRGFRAAFPDT